MDPKDLFIRAKSAKNGSLFIQGKPGMAKSAIAKKMADEHGYKFVDLRLSMLDETAVGGLVTKVTKIVNGKEVMVTTTAYPEWAVGTWEHPTVVCMEELNRCSSYVKNAALGILNERRIGNFELAPETILLATGNLGEADDCEVEDFDAALRNRLVWVNYDMTLSEWKAGYANEHVNKHIVNFVTECPQHYYKYSKEGAYATPRSWTYLSDYMKGLEEAGITGMEQVSKINAFGSDYVGSSALEFASWMAKKYEWTIKDLIKGKVKVPEQMDRSDMTRLMADLRAEFPDAKLDKKGFDNLEKFLKIVDEDFVAAWIIETVKNPQFTAKDNPVGWEFLRSTEWLATIGKKALAKNQTENKADKADK